VVLLAAEYNPQLADADDGRHVADPLARRLELAALLDVRLEIGDMAFSLPLPRSVEPNSCRAEHARIMPRTLT
jgi:hypothetical protein